MHPSQRTRRFPMPRRPKRKSNLLIPLILVGLFLYIANKDKSDKRGKPTRSNDAHAMDRTQYPDGPDGTRLALQDGLEKATFKERQLQRKKAGFETELKEIDQLLREFKTAYKAAQGGSPWPVPVRGRDYNEVQLTSKVQTLLAHQEDRAERIRLVEQQIQSTTEIMNMYSTKLDEFELALARQETEREKARIRDLSTEADEWITEKADDVAPIEEETTGSVRSLEDIMEAEEKLKNAQPVVSQQTLQFLSGPQ